MLATVFCHFFKSLMGKNIRVINNWISRLYFNHRGWIKAQNHQNQDHQTDRVEVYAEGLIMKVVD